jgi:hypothetical protein
MPKQVWMVRAGRDSVFIDDFLSRQMIAIGWSKLGDLSNVHNRDQFHQLVQQSWPENNKFQNSASAGQVYRFREEVAKGANVVTYDSNRRIYHMGTVTGDYVYHPDHDPELVQRFIKIFTYQGIEMSSFFQRCTTGAALISAMPSRILCLSSAFDLTRIWRRKVCAILPKRVSTKLSHDPCLGVWT